MEPPENVLAYREASIEIGAPPAAVYELVADLSRMGEWSPESVGGEWLDGGTGKTGDWFEGQNRSGDREWTRQSEVALAEPNTDFTFVVGGVEANCTWWSYEVAPSGEGTTLTEKWWIVNKTAALQAATDEQVQARIDMTQGSLEATLAALKATAEA